MEIAEIVRLIIDIGITPVLLLLFVRYFLSQDEKRAAQVQEEYRKAQERIEDAEKDARERESLLLAEAQRREDLIRTDALEREKLIRRENEKREGVLLTSLERVTSTMDKISTSMQDIQGTIARMDERLDRLERGVMRYGPAGDRQSQAAAGQDHIQTV